MSSDHALSDLAELAVALGVLGADEPLPGLLEFAYRLMAHVSKDPELATPPSLLLAMTAMRLAAAEEGYRQGNIDLPTALGLEPPGKRDRDVARHGFDVYCDVEEKKLQGKAIDAAFIDIAAPRGVSDTTIARWYYAYRRERGLGEATAISRTTDGTAVCAWVNAPGLSKTAPK